MAIHLPKASYNFSGTILIWPFHSSITEAFTTVFDAKTTSSFIKFFIHWRLRPNSPEVFFLLIEPFTADFFGSFFSTCQHGHCPCCHSCSLAIHMLYLQANWTILMASTFISICINSKPTFLVYSKYPLSTIYQTLLPVYITNNSNVTFNNLLTLCFRGLSIFLSHK